MLVGIPEVPSAPSNAFTLLAVSAGEPKVINETVEACGQYFWVKGDGACSYCPPVVERTGFCPAGNETVLFGSSLVTASYRSDLWNHSNFTCGAVSRGTRRAALLHRHP